MKQIKTIIKIVCLLLPSVNIFATYRFPKPEFNSGYKMPVMPVDISYISFQEYINVFILFTLLTIASFLIFKKRSRHGIFLLTVFSAIYFGFYQKGCICSVGSLQNITAALFNSNYSLTIPTILFFFIPIFFALFFGRIFCSSICPLGAIQELFIMKPLKLPFIVTEVLKLIPFIYLGLAIIYSATDTFFIICKYDPFIGFYRLEAPFSMVITGAIFLIISIYIARPYCRFVCPYGIILGFFSYFSWKHLSISPDTCITCNLCQNSCPVDAIQKPTKNNIKLNPARIKNLSLSLIILPAIIMLSGFSLSKISFLLSQHNKQIKLYHQLTNLKQSALTSKDVNIDAFYNKNLSLQKLALKTKQLESKFKTGAWWLGCFLGLIIGLKIINLIRINQRTEYSPDKFHCISCARCMEYCPVKPKIEIKDEK